MSRPAVFVYLHGLFRDLLSGLSGIVVYHQLFCLIFLPEAYHLSKKMRERIGTVTAFFTFSVNWYRYKPTAFASFRRVWRSTLPCRINHCERRSFFTKLCYEL